MNDDLKCCHLDLWPFYATNLLLSTSFYSCHTLLVAQRLQQNMNFGWSTIHCFRKCANLRPLHISTSSMSHQLFCILSRLFTVQANLINRLAFYCQSKMIILLLLCERNVVTSSHTFGNFAARKRNKFTDHIQSDWIESDLHLSGFFETKNGCRRKMWTNF